jgi:hypothetical protein
MRLRRFATWVYSSLIGHVVFFELVVTVPLLAMFFYLNRDTLSLDWVLRMVLISPVLVGMGAAYVWYSNTLPSLRRRGLKPRR